MGTLTPTSGNGWWANKARGETPAEKLIRTPFLLIFFLTNLLVFSALAHKEMRFLASIIQIGSIAQAYMITWMLDCREVGLKVLQLRGADPRSSLLYRSMAWTSGWLVKGFAIYVMFVQEQGRIVRLITNNHYKNDSSLETYNMFLGRSELVGDEQPESVYFLDKFMQPTHLYLHSHPRDYPKTAARRG